jgi:hypothetical protein
MSFANSDPQLLPPSRLGFEDRDAPDVPTLRARVLASLRHGALDRRLADGEDAGDDRELSVRAWQLTRPRARMRLANTLEAILTEVEQPRGRRSASVPACREEVEVARGEMVWLAERLRDPRPVRARGVLLVRGLLSDGNSPLFVASPNDELWRQARRASAALD